MRPAEWPLRKLRRAKRRGYYRTADLFSGCGGMTLGFDRAGYRCVTAIENDTAARESHARNFRGRARPGQYAMYRDITKVRPKQAVKHLRNKSRRTEDSIDIVIGGPPCQAFSRLGRAALWSVKGRRHAHADDPRASLYEHFMSYVEELKPIAFVLENVPDMGRFHGTNVAEEIALAANDLGYVTRYSLLNSAWYGVPQLRERLFVIGIRRELQVVPSFPEMTHLCDLPKGYLTSRAGQFNLSASAPVLKPFVHYVDHAGSSDSTIKAATVSNAFGDLPILKKTTLQRPRGIAPNAELLNANKKYRGQAKGFAHDMRSWPGFSSNGSCSGHVTRFTPRDFPIFRRMKPRDRYPEALRLAENLFKHKVRRIEQRTNSILGRRTRQWKELRKATVPPYSATRFPDKFRKLHPKEPSPTVPAHLGKDCYSHIHPSRCQARTISIREAARLQSFPDAFELFGAMGKRFTQIGNAVPPLLAYAVASHLRGILEGYSRRKSKP